MAQASTSASAISHFNAADYEIDPPSWMNKEFFTEVLRKCEKTDEVLVKEIKITPASAKDDYYASVEFRGSVIYDIQNSKENSKSLIIKTILEELAHVEGVFESEISIYSETIPKFEAELRKVGDNTIFAEEVLYYSLEPRKVIIFEDMCPKGYAELRGRKWNIEEVKAAFFKLAKLHAVSYKLAAEGDTSVTSYEEHFLNFKPIEEIPFIALFVDSYINELLNHETFKQHTSKLCEIKKDLFKSSLNSSKIDLPKGSEGILALCHGEFHQGNIMFKYNSSGSVEDAILVDFQVSHYGLALMDVLNGLCMLTHVDMCTQSSSDIVHYYSLSFIEILKELKFQGKIPKVSELFIEFSRVKDLLPAEIRKIVLGKLVIANLK